MSRGSQVFLDRLGGRLSGEMDMAVAPAAEIDFLAMALRTPGSTLHIDCAGLTFIDSSGARMLEHVALRSGKRVQLLNLSPGCRRVVEVLGLSDTFGIEGPRGPGR